MESKQNFYQSGNLVCYLLSLPICLRDVDSLLTNEVVMSSHEPGPGIKAGKYSRRAERQVK